MRHSPSRRTMLAGLIVLVLLMPAFPATAVTADPMNSASSADAIPSEADAIRFRATFGFDSSLALVRVASAESSRYSNMDYGVPLDAAEVAELTRRATIQAAIDPIVEQVAANDTFAGMYLDQRAGGPRFSCSRLASLTGPMNSLGSSRLSSVFARAWQPARTRNSAT